MAYRSEEEKGLSNSFLLGTANEDCGDHQSEQQSVFQRPCMGSDLCVQVWAWKTHAVTCACRCGRGQHMQAG